MKITIKETVSKAFMFKQKVLTTMGVAIPKKVANWGYYKAVSIAPHDTGATKRALNIVYHKNSAKLRLNRPSQHRKDGPRNYHLWMHGLGGKDIGKHIKTGDPKFMFTTGKLMSKYAKDLAAKAIKKKR